MVCVCVCVLGGGGGKARKPRVGYGRSGHSVAKGDHQAGVEWPLQPQPRPRAQEGKFSNPALPVGIQAPGSRCWEVAYLTQPARNGEGQPAPLSSAGLSPYWPRAGCLLAGPAWMEASPSLLPGVLASTSSGWAEVRDIGMGEEGRAGLRWFWQLGFIPGVWGPHVPRARFQRWSSDYADPDSPSACPCQDGSCPRGEAPAPFSSNQSVSVAIPGLHTGWGGVESRSRGKGHGLQAPPSPLRVTPHPYP